MTTKADLTRELLLDAGEQLFARHGVTAVSVAQITKKAQQRNGAAVHYHFGGRDGLLQAILERHHAQLDAERMRRLNTLKAGGELTVHSLVAVVVEPMAACLQTESGRAFLKIQAHRLGSAREEQVPPAKSMRALRDELAELVPERSPLVSQERGRLAALLLSQRLGLRADEEAQGNATPDRSVLIDILTNAIAALLEAP